MADELREASVRQVYLVTYSQADLERFPTRRSFADAILEAFNSSTNVVILQWVCSAEKHRDGGTHYHMAIKMDRCQRWLPIRDCIESSFGINVNFSNRHVNYFTAYAYVTKEDRSPVLSENHPDLSGPPRTMAASQTVSQSSQLQETLEPPRKRQRSRLTNFQVGQIIREKRLKNRTDLLAFADAQQKEGKCDLSEFIFNRSRKVLHEVMTTAWEMESAQEDLERSRMARLTILERALTDPCVPGCNLQWITQAEDILSRNHIPRQSFAGAIHDLLQHGRGKYRNVILIGPANCGKTFILGPLSVLYKAFSNPATTTFAWVGVEDAEIIVLNDFRWTSQVNTFLPNKIENINDKRLYSFYVNRL